VSTLRRWLALAICVTTPLGAQTVTFSVSSAGAAFASPGTAAYAAGFIDNTTPITYTLTLANPELARSSLGFITTVQVQATATTYGTKPLSDLQVRVGGGAFQSMASNPTWVTVATQTLTSTVTTATGSIFLRALLEATDGGATYSVPLRFQILVTRK